MKKKKEKILAVFLSLILVSVTWFTPIMNGQSVSANTTYSGTINFDDDGGGIDDTYTTRYHIGGYTLVGKEVDYYDDGSSRYGRFMAFGSGSGYEMYFYGAEVEINFENNELFDISSLKLYNRNDRSLDQEPIFPYITGYRNGVAVAWWQYKNYMPVGSRGQTINLKNFINIDKLVIDVEENSYIAVDNLVVSNVRQIEAPTDVTLSNDSFSQSAGTNAEIGTFSSVDTDAGDTHTYSLVSGSGDADNSKFNISGNTLRANNATTMMPGTHFVRVRTTDVGGRYFEKAFTVNVINDVSSVTYHAGAGGTITGTTSQRVIHGQDATAVTAEPNIGYLFVSWSDGVTSATRTDTNVTNDISVTANFTPEEMIAVGASPIKTTSFHANWDYLEWADTYRLDVSTEPDFSSFVGRYHNLNVGNVTSFHVTGLTPGHTYYYRVRAETTNWVSENSNPIEVTLLNDTTPPNIEDSNIEVTINWNKATDDQTVQNGLEYKAYLSRTNNIATVEEIEANPDVIALNDDFKKDIDRVTIQGLEEGATYYFNVIVKDEAGNKSAYSMKEVNLIESPTNPGDGGNDGITPTNPPGNNEPTNPGGSTGGGGTTPTIPGGSTGDGGSATTPTNPTGSTFGGGGTNTPVNVPTEINPDKSNNVEKPQEGLSDITGHWAKGNIVRLIGLGAISGYPDGSFKPNNHITRAEFTAILVRTLGLEVELGKVYQDTEKHWAKDVIATAQAHGMINGYDEQTFGANDPITREQMATMIVNAFKLEEAKGTTFKDNNHISLWAQKAVETAASHGILTGLPNGSFNPKNNATRAEAATVIIKALDQ